jgi:hypothetical protein
MARRDDLTEEDYVVLARQGATRCPWEAVGKGQKEWAKQRHRCRRTDGTLDEEAFIRWLKHPGTAGYLDRNGGLKGFQRERRPDLWRKDFDPRHVLEVLHRHKGSAYAAAEELGCSAVTLRAFVRKTPELVAEVDAWMESAVDKAMEILWQAANCDSMGLRLAAAKEFLRTRQARDRGFGATGAALELKNRNGGTIAIAWLDPAEPEPKLIEGEAERDEVGRSGTNGRDE